MKRQNLTVVKSVEPQRQLELFARLIIPEIWRLKTDSLSLQGGLEQTGDLLKIWTLQIDAVGVGLWLAMADTNWGGSGLVVEIALRDVPTRERRLPCNRAHYSTNRIIEVTHQVRLEQAVAVRISSPLSVTDRGMPFGCEARADKQPEG